LFVFNFAAHPQAIELVNAGVAKRKTYETQMNAVSSRSHTCFTLTITQTGIESLHPAGILVLSCNQLYVHLL
jgi:hypothetical protein